MPEGLCWTRQDDHAEIQRRLDVGGGGGRDDGGDGGGGADDGGGADGDYGGADGDAQKGGKQERNSCSNTRRPKSQPRPGPISTLHTLTVSSGSRCL